MSFENYFLKCLFRINIEKHLVKSKKAFRLTFVSTKVTENKYILQKKPNLPDYSLYLFQNYRQLQFIKIVYARKKVSAKLRSDQELFFKTSCSIYVV